MYALANWVGGRTEGGGKHEEGGERDGSEHELDGDAEKAAGFYAQCEQAAQCTRVS